MATLAGGAAGCGAGVDTAVDTAVGEACAACAGAGFEASRLEIRLSGWRMYHTAPAARRSVAAMPMRRPFFEREATAGVGTLDSPSNCPPKVAECGRRWNSVTPPAGDSSEAESEAGRVAVSAGSSGTATGSAVVDSDSCARGASHAGTLTCSAASERGTKLRTGAAGLISAGAAGFGPACANCRSLSATSGMGDSVFAMPAGAGEDGGFTGVSVKRREPSCS